MDYLAKSNKIDTLASRLLVVAVYTDGKKATLGNNAALLDARANRRLRTLVARGDISGEPGSTLLVHDPAGIRAERVLLVGMGKAAETGARELRQAAEAAAGAARAANVRSLDIALMDRRHGRMNTRRMARHVVEAMDAVL